MDRVDLVYVDAGGGHRASAEALSAALNMDERRSWQVRLVNLQEVLRPLDRLGRLTGVSVEDAYNLMLRKNWTWGADYLLPFLHFAIRCYHPRQVELLADYWQDDPPGIVVSMVSHFNRALRDGIRRAGPSVPFAVILTDFADVPPHFWIEPQDQFVICGSVRAAAQARALNIPPNRIYQTSGMILHPRFYAPADPDRAAGRERLGLDPALRTGIVTFGGQGSDAMIEIVRRIESSRLDLQLILMCGRNAQLASRLRMTGRLRRVAVDYTTEMPQYMALADFFIGKPGPASISEAVHMGLPVIVDCGPRTMPQERYNAEWVLEQRVGLVLPNFSVIAGAVEQMLSPGQYSMFRTNALAMKNRAVFETVQILHQIQQDVERVPPAVILSAAKNHRI